MFFIRVAAVTSKLVMRYTLDHAITPLMKLHAVLGCHL